MQPGCSQGLLIPPNVFIADYASYRQGHKRDATMWCISYNDVIPASRKRRCCRSRWRDPGKHRHVVRYGVL